jgi:hypothetical protein
MKAELMEEEVHSRERKLYETALAVEMDEELRTEMADQPSFLLMRLNI